jgi:hypothetical protein
MFNNGNGLQNLLEVVMPFPVTHLYIAERVLTLRPMPEDAAASFLLGAIAPDGVHYRPNFNGDAKKQTHLCPESDEKWGRVTENDKWQKMVVNLSRFHQSDPFMLGYFTHIISDICNNREIWMPYVKKHPKDAAKGYASDYYKNIEQLDSYLYQQLKPNNRIERLIKKAPIRDAPGLVTAEEVDAIRYNAFTKDIDPTRKNIFFTSYPDKPPADLSDCRYVSLPEVESLIENAAQCAVRELFPQV